MRHKRIVPALLAALAVSGGSAIAAQSPSAGVAPTLAKASEPATTTPIKHVVIIFQENVSFDHYFGTYRTRRTPTGRSSKPPRTRRPSTG
jgi:phospholipase C